MGPEGYTGFFAVDPAVAYNPPANEYLVVWEGNDTAGPLGNTGQEIYGQRLSAAGGQVGAHDFRLSDMGTEGDTSFNAFEPAVAYNGASNEYLVVWSGDDNTGPLVDQEYEIFGQRVSAATGAEVGANDFRISDMGPDGDTGFGAFDSAVTYNGTNNEYLVVWSGDDNTGPLAKDEFEVFGQRLAATGAEVGENDFRLSDLGPDGDTRFGAGSPAVAYNRASNEYLVVWGGDDNTGQLANDESEIFGQRYAAPDPPPSPPPLQIVAGQFRRKGVTRVRVRDAATGAVRAVLTPFKGYRGRLRLALRDLNGDGALDLIVQALIKGKRKTRAYDAVTLAPLPPGPA